MEFDLLKPLDFKVPNPNHCFYIELLISIFSVTKEQEMKIKESLDRSFGKLNFFALCPKIVSVFLFSQLFEFDSNLERTLKITCEMFEISY